MIKLFLMPWNIDISRMIWLNLILQLKIKNIELILEIILRLMSRLKREEILLDKFFLLRVVEDQRESILHGNGWMLIWAKING